MNITPYSTNPDIAKVEKNSRTEEQKLKEACQGFEAMFIHQMMKTMRESSQEGGFIEKSNGEEIFTDLLDMELSDQAAKSNRGGMADMLFEQLKSTLEQTNNPEPREGNRSLKGYMPAKRGNSLDMAM
ncbi:MAG: rod-binding protein [Deferribacteraceae bacterium]|jgi:flagellar protein FlgJ|nr:rod-binding protein [Deferribacteraceae bacterium]